MSVVHAVDLKTLSPSSITTFGGFTGAIVSNVFVIAGIATLFMMVLGGFQILTSAGNPKQMEKGKGALTGAVLGLLLIFASFWIIEIIQTLTGIQILNPVIP